MKNYTAHTDGIARLRAHQAELVERYKTAMLRHDRRESRRVWDLRQRVEHALALKLQKRVEPVYPSIAA